MGSSTAVFSGANGFADFDAMTVSRLGSFELERPPKEALPLFTAPGERLWVPGWEPVILHGDGYETGTAFITEHGEHTTYWLVIDYDVGAGHAAYARVTPGLHTGTVDVSIAENGSGGSRVTVTYQMTGLSDHGNGEVERSYNEVAYAEMMTHWQSLIVEHAAAIDAHLGR
ncbi:MAG: SRPBCC family protein [Pseudomonadota bacterium]